MIVTVVDPVAKELHEMNRVLKRIADALTGPGHRFIFVEDPDEHVEILSIESLDGEPDRHIVVGGDILERET